MTTRYWGNTINVNASSTGTQNQPVVTALNDGGFMIAWTDSDPAIDVIRMQRFDASGNLVGPEFVPFDDAANVSGGAADLVQLADGNIWYQATRYLGGPSSLVDGQVVSLSGADVRDQYLENTDNSAEAALASLGINGAAGVFVNLAANDGDIMLDIFDASGGPGVDNFVVNTNVAGTQGTSQRQPDIAANAAGNLIAVVWTDDGLNSSDIRCRVLDNTGVEVAGEFTVNTAAGNVAAPQTEPAVAWLDSEKFVVAWSSSADGQGDPSQAIKYAIYSANGGLLVPEQLANTKTQEAQFSPVVTALPDGGFVIAWTDFVFNPEPTGDIRLQVFDGNGAKRGGEIVAHTDLGGSQATPSLATLADGRVVVTWDDSSGDVAAQIIDPRDGQISGTTAADMLYGHESVGDQITGFEGGDTIFGLGGDDTVYAGAGADTVTLGRGDDIAYGGADNDDLRGDGGEDQLFGDAGNDTLRGGNADDELHGGAGNEIMLGGAGADVLNGGTGTDTASYFGAATGVTTALDGSVAKSGDALGDSYVSVESLVGTNQDDTLAGNTGTNTLDGRGGADTLDGKTGSDRLIGGVDADTMAGGTGNDVFVFAGPTEGSDTITDFSQVSGNNDRFELKASTFGGGLVAGSPLLGEQFQDTNSSSPANDLVRLIYNQATGELFFDADGNLGGAATILLATLGNNANLGLGDFTIV